eukprot:TRINITY_DN4379_c0_g1_i2.p1 TRINITY_DN4379_c0_g1~~TRINITY_DN4379_c0_g1_i2.p1  ORF type:complete len:439 (-),score=105.41 TRINITY_DN4379_c0_g1_i2:231-1547(-)
MMIATLILTAAQATSVILIGTNMREQMPSESSLLAEKAAKVLQESQSQSGIGVSTAGSAEVEDELNRLRAALAQREATCLRLEGENFILGSQVQQLQQQTVEMTKDAQTCQAQLAQAQQVLDGSVSGRMPLKADVDHVRAIIATSRRSLRRLTTNSTSGSVSCLPALNRLRVAAAANVGGAGGADSAPAPVRSGRTSPRGEARSPGRTATKSQQSQSASRRSPGRPRQSTGGGSVSSTAAADNDASNGHGSPPASPKITSRGILVNGKKTDAADGKPEFQLAFLRQRELLMAAIRRGVDLQESVLKLQDDLIRREVIIHNLRHDQSIHQQETQQQQQLFESQMQQLQSQHQLQELQQMKELAEMQALLQNNQLLHLLREDAVDSGKNSHDLADGGKDGLNLLQVVGDGNSVILADGGKDGGPVTLAEDVGRPASAPVN